ncbi:diguanylate cyclase (GGDEF)-like protein [Pseudomonas duriflava]|uniref:diguanylate cyclase n=1 Tax=Pseudomonas duriflava TaxID=459528 RepID=A0A562QFQ0_9PSED|nr:sensor domain-containing diguanylate cyclase [Pseudomonas duriflava]TWI55587.1 diguanylate cyclase (GGDEF)-like protein [Pseudomonas duriflava]
MPKPKRLPILALTMFFIVAVALALIALDVLQAWNARQVHWQAAHSETNNFARSLAQHASDTFKEADTSLIGIVERLEFEGATPASLQRIQKLQERYTNHLPQLHELLVTDEKGRALVATLPGTFNATYDDREYFRYHQTDTSPKPHIGPAIRSRSTGTWVITISRRYNHPDGRFAGVVLASLKMDYFQQFYDGFDIDRAGAISLTLSDGQILVRRPYDEAAIGLYLGNTQIFKDLLPQHPKGHFIRVSPVDKIERMYSYSRVDNYPLVIFAAKSKQAIFEDWLINTYRYSAITAVVVILLCLLGGLLYREIQQGVKTEAKLLNTQKALEVANRELEQVALYDGLTGLANRRQFDIQLETEFKRALRHGTSLSLILIDIDHFKGYNDSYGHLAGDECLRVISQVIDRCLQRPGDLAARYGGEELVVLLPETEDVDAYAIAEMLRRRVADLNLIHRATPCGKVSISAGVHGFVPVAKERTPQDLIRYADQALYRAKASGRNRVCLFREMVTEEIRPD